MKPRTLLVAVLLLAAFLYGLGTVLARDPRLPNVEPLPADMVRSPAAKSGAATDAFPDGLVQRTPPAGTVARGRMPVPYGEGLEEAARAGRELVNPVPDLPEVLERGAVVFKYQCAVCHGLGGLGDGEVTKNGRRFPPPPSFLRPETRALPDGEIFHAITFGRKNMPSAAASVDPDDRWKVIRYVRSLQAAAPPAPPGEPGPTAPVEPPKEGAK